MCHMFWDLLPGFECLVVRPPIFNATPPKDLRCFRFRALEGVLLGLSRSLGAELSELELPVCLCLRLAISCESNSEVGVNGAKIPAIASKSLIDPSSLHSAVITGLAEVSKCSAIAIASSHKVWMRISFWLVASPFPPWHCCILRGWRGLVHARQLSEEHWSCA